MCCSCFMLFTLYQRYYHHSPVATKGHNNLKCDVSASISQQCIFKPGKPGTLRVSSEPGTLREISGNFCTNGHRSGGFSFSSSERQWKTSVLRQVGGDDRAYNPAHIFSGKPMKLLVLMQTTLLLQMQMLLKLVEHDLLPD